MRKRNWLRLLATGVITVLLLSLCACAGGGTASSAPAGDGAVDAVEDAPETTTTTATTAATTIATTTTAATMAKTTKKIPTTTLHDMNDATVKTVTTTDPRPVWIRFVYPDGSPAVGAVVNYSEAPDKDGGIPEDYIMSEYEVNEEGMFRWRGGPRVAGREFYVCIEGKKGRYTLKECTKEETDNEIIYTYIVK